MLMIEVSLWPGCRVGPVRPLVEWHGVSARAGGVVS